MSIKTVYTLLSRPVGDVENELEDLVNDLLSEGWGLHGGPFYGAGNVYQAMILEPKHDGL